MTDTPFMKRIKRFYDRLMRNAILRQGDPVSDLADFVRSEIGRSHDERLEDSQALVLYFKDDEDRRNFVAAVRAEIVTRGHERDAIRAKELP